jgi:hypothetical protein
MAQSLSSAAEANPNSAARADTIRNAVQQLAQYDAQVKRLRGEITEFKAKTIKGELGFKLSDWNAVYRVSQLEIEDRDTLLETIREGFAALHIGGVVDWVAAAETAQRRRATVTGAAPDEAARTAGRQDGLGGVIDHAARWRVLALGEGAPGHTTGETAPRRGRGRPRKAKEPEAGAEL